MFEPITILASFGLILATAGFISGLQALRNRNSIDTRIHKFNGYLSALIYLLLSVISLSKPGGATLKAAIAWGAGLLIIFTKIWVVKSGRAYKYASWLGILLIIVWLIIIYTHI